MIPKTCSRCKHTFPIESFYRCRSKSDGHDNYCSNCRRIIQKQPHIMAALREVSARHRQKYPERERARQIANRAIRKGTLLRGSCAMPGCGSLEVEAHHEDYLRPLDVIWLCKRHHNELHLAMKEQVEVAA